MSILIKDMEMPKNCDECPCRMIGYTKDHCNVLGKFIDCVVGSEGRREDCPLVEVPQHGDLIDRDVLRASFKESIDEYHKWANEVPNDTMFYARVSQALGTFVECALRTKGMPTVIPAEIATKDPPTGTFKGDELFVFKEEGET